MCVTVLHRKSGKSGRGTAPVPRQHDKVHEARLTVSPSHGYFRRGSRRA
jgi:hypothetical protein